MAGVFWDDLIRRLRRDNRAFSPSALRAMAGHVAVLPAPRPRGRRNLGILIAAMAGLLAVLAATGQVRF
jgi:hypothetical protein